MQFIARLCADYASAYRIAVIHYRAFPYHLSFATAFVVLIAGLDALVPYLLREVANRFSSKDPTAAGYAIVLAGAYGLTWTAARVSEWMKNMMSAAVLSRCDAAFQHAMSDHLMRVEYGRLTALDIGRVVAIMTRSRNAFSTITFTFFWALGPTLLQLVFATVVLCQVADPVIGSAFLISMSALFALTCWLADRSKGAHADIFEADNQVTSHILERLTFALDIKLNGAYDGEQSALRRLLRQYVHETSSGSARLALLLAAQAFFAGLALTVLAVAAATRVAKGALTIGDYVMVVGYAVAVTMPFTTLAASLSEMRKSQVSIAVRG
jgi:ABC-type multidrug transport system fused ATPase/permease subunit